MNQCLFFEMDNFWVEYENNLAVTKLPQNCGVCMNYKNGKCAFMTEFVRAS
jgi:hypothetical protein